jgi:hypothetical protein
MLAGRHVASGRAMQVPLSDNMMLSQKRNKMRPIALFMFLVEWTEVDEDLRI